MTTGMTSWAAWLRRVAGPAGSISPAAGAFSDEAGHRREVDGPFLDWRRRCRGEDTQPAALEGRSPDVVLWSALTRPGIDPAVVLRRFDGPRAGFDSGSLFPAGAWAALEVWTEVELCSLQALWWLARERRNAALAVRVREVALWHLENVQPDNATNHPWGLPVFIEVAERESNHDARLLAETLIHNCQVSMGRPDALSVEILLDAADAADAMARE